MRHYWSNVRVLIYVFRPEMESFVYLIAPYIMVSFKVFDKFALWASSVTSGT